jgi:hypothetical protein
MLNRRSLERRILWQRTPLAKRGARFFVNLDGRVAYFRAAFLVSLALGILAVTRYPRLCTCSNYRHSWVAFATPNYVVAEVEWRL